MLTLTWLRSVPGCCAKSSKPMHSRSTPSVSASGTPVVQQPQQQCSVLDRLALNMVSPIFFTRRQICEPTGASTEVWTLGRGRQQSEASCSAASATISQQTLFSEHPRVSIVSQRHYVSEHKGIDPPSRESASSQHTLICAAGKTGPWETCQAKGKLLGGREREGVAWRVGDVRFGSRRRMRVKVRHRKF